MDGRVGELLGGTGIETLDGVALLGEVLAVIGVESRMALRRYLVVGDGEVLDVEETGTGIVMMTTGGCRHPERIVIRHLPDVADVEAAVGTVETAETVGEAGEGREIRGLVVHPAETLDTIERVDDPYDHTRRGVLCGIFAQGRLYNNT